MNESGLTAAQVKHYRDALEYIHDSIAEEASIAGTISKEDRGFYNGITTALELLRKELS